MHPVPFKPVDGVSLEITGLEEMKWDKDAKLGAVKLTHRNHLVVGACSLMGALCTSVATGKEASRHPGRDYRNQPLKGHLVCISLLLMHILDVKITGIKKNISQVSFSGCSDKT